MKTLLTIFYSLSFFALQLYATPQIPDKLDIGPERLSVHGFMVNDLLKKQMDKAETKHGSGYSLSSSANHRGFVATLEVKGDKLFLKTLQIEVYSEERNNALKELSEIHSKGLKDKFKDRVQELYNVIQEAGIIKIPLGFMQNRGHADWFSGELYHYYGKPLSYRYTHRLSQVRILTFSQGNLVSDKNISVEE